MPVKRKPLSVYNNNYIGHCLACMIVLDKEM